MTKTTTITVLLLLSAATGLFVYSTFSGQSIWPLQRPAPQQPSDPSVKNTMITYPTGGEHFNVGDTVTFQWKPQQQRNTSMWLLLSNGIVVSKRIDPSLGTYTWTIPAPEKATCSGFSDALSMCKPEKYDGPLYLKAGIYSPKDACVGFCGVGNKIELLSTDTTGDFFIKR